MRAQTLAREPRVIEISRHRAFVDGYHFTLFIRFRERLFVTSNVELAANCRLPDASDERSVFRSIRVAKQRELPELGRRVCNLQGNARGELAAHNVPERIRKSTAPHRYEAKRRRITEQRFAGLKMMQTSSP